jgi:membrane protease YdiL (CAAX protease family)/tetratricopeptide (TPR) repeat protein
MAVRFLGYLCVIVACAIGAMAQSNDSVRFLQPRGVTPLSDNEDEKEWKSEVSTLEREATEYYDAGQFDLAIKAASELLAKNTNDTHAVWRLGSSYYMLNDFEHAAEAYGRFAKLRPRSSYGHLWEGICLSRQKKFDEAEAALREATRLNPKDPIAHEELGYCLKSLNHYAEAGTEFERAIDYGGYTGYRCIEGGYSFAKAKDFATAVPLLNEGVMLEKTNIYAWDWLGWSYYNLRNYDKAAATFTQALKIEPGRFFPQYWLANTFLMDRKYEQACDAFGKALKAKPNDLYVRRAYANTLLRCERAAEAINVVEPYATNKSLRLTLFTAYTMNNDYKKAVQLYPVASTVAVILLGLAFVTGSILLLYKSFKPSMAEHVHLGFAIGWVFLYFESQIALILFAGLFTSAKLLIGLLLSPIILFIAAFVAFPKQPWGQAFRPARISWKQVGLAAGGWFTVMFVAGVYATVMTNVLHHRPEPRNIRFVLNLIHEHKIWAGIVVAVIAPITEEILFRGLLFSALSKWMKPIWVIVVSAAIFGAVHMDAVYFLILFLLGVLLGWARHTSKSIWFSIAIHMFQNGLAYVGLMLS